MTSDSRVEAVLEAIGDLVRDGRSAWEIAQAAIEANDAWLKERGWRAAPHTMTDEMAMHAVAVQPLSGLSDLKETMKRGWRVAIKFAPSPEEAKEVDR